jgi:predicted nucleic acid-binding protein
MFVDSNILIYNAQDGSPFKDQANAAMKRAAKMGQALSISRQVLREYASVMTGTKSGQTPMLIADVSKDLSVFCEKFKLLEDGPTVWTMFEQLMQRHKFGGKQVHDAYLVATMLAHEENKILTANRADFQRFSSDIEIFDL